MHGGRADVWLPPVARGACVIEKHFTLDRNMPGPDHAASLEPAELKQMVQAIRHVQLALGSELKQPTTDELSNRIAARRSVVANRPIKQGEVISMDMLTAKRPGTGLSPMDIWSLQGRVADRDYGKDELVLP